MEKDHGKGGLEKGQGTRGGAIRKPSLDMKEEELSQFFDDIVRKKGAKAFDFGVYNTLDVAQAASAQGLMECQAWLRGILPLCDDIPKPLPLKKQVLRFTTLNETDMKHSFWASSISSKIITLFNHWRRLKNNPERRRQCLKKATEVEAERLGNLLKLEPGHGEAWRNASSASSNVEACKKAKKASLEPEEPCKGAMEEQEEACDKASDMEVDKAWLGDDGISEVSIDSKGFPMILKTPEASREGSGEAAASSGLKQGQSPPTALKGLRSPKTPKARGSKQGPSSPKAAGARGLKESQSPDSARLPFLSKRAQSHKAALEQQAAEAAERLATKSPPTKEKKANQVKKRPAMGKKLAKRPAAAIAGQRLETRPALKRPASQSTSAVEQKKQEQGPEIRPGFSGWLKVKAGKYTKQGYIQGCWGDKWILLVACTEKQAAQYPGGHGAVIDALLPHCGTQGMTKAKLVELRNGMLAQHTS